MHFEAEMYHAAAKSFVCAQLATVREHSVLPCGCACADEFTGAVRRHQTTELRNTGMLRLHRVNRMYSSNVSVIANRLRKTRK